jgi:hypothetical protein
VIDEDAGQLVTDGLVHEGRGHRRVDPAGETADHLLVADLLADPGDLVLDDVAGRPGRLDAGDVVEETLQHRLALLGVRHLGVEMHARPLGRQVLERGHRGTRGGRGHRETLRGHRDAVAVAHPHRQAGGELAQQGAASGGESRVRPYSREPVCATVPPSAWAIAWKP